MEPHLELAEVEGQPFEIGRDPRKMTEPELAAIGHHKRPLLAAIRQNCIEWCCGGRAEVRRCRIVTCPMWPYRMGTNPFRHHDLTDEQRDTRRIQLKQARGAKSPGKITGEIPGGSRSMISRG
jgi:hypothetical protein